MFCYSDKVSKEDQEFYKALRELKRNLVKFLKPESHKDFAEPFYQPNKNQQIDLGYGENQPLLQHPS